ncbi:DUF721 domain-containing protein [Arcobacter arenosus]|jgi:hypothetical protein|uniref:DUF721 domain-containing protein n=1 Tax=Arcobacter arenosus TaxID=2576037 RepID=A0A5R8Y075_9BACT|nr:DUF721 domain-containing protein [Arcobacter arenosus]TLP37610.1 DUF721 domain-containing protein [Arcobacter arenosus]
MKKVNEILSHLKNNPEFRKINTQATIIKFIELLPDKLKKGVKFAYVKREILFFVLSHPVYKMEFEYNKSLINDLLKQANIANVQELRFFVTNKIEKKKKEEVIPMTFKERSFGIFENKITNEKLHAKVEEIRKLIKNS